MSWWLFAIPAGLFTGGLVLWVMCDEIVFWRNRAEYWQKVADARFAELHEMHDELDRALAEDHQVAALEAIWEMEPREPSA